MEEEEFLEKTVLEEKAIISTNKFILLNLLTFNLYAIWWVYTSWRFFKEREDLEIYPVARALFSIFFLYELFNKIKYFAKSNGHEKEYSSGLLLLGILSIVIISYFPGPISFLSICSSMFYIKPFEALNYGIEASGHYHVAEQRGFDTAQIIMLVIGFLLWGGLIISLVQPSIITL